MANARRYCRLDNGISSSSEYTGDTEDQADDVDQEQLDRSVSADEEDTRVDVLDDLDSAEITESDPGRHLSFDDFEHWLKSPDGGLKPVKSAKQHKQQVMVIGGAVGKNCDCLDIINTKLIRERFLDHYVKEQKFLPGTTRSYLTSVVHFCNYVLDHEAVAEEDKVRVSTAAQCIRRWITAFRKECNQRVLEKMDDDISKLIKPEDVSTFENSELSKEAVKFLGAVASGEIDTISSLQYINVRDYLLARIVLANANRTGVLANLETEQVRRARNVDGHMVISVSKHKSAWKYGPAKLVLSNILYRWLKVFVDSVVPMISGAATGVFLATTGEAMTSGQITKQLQSVWKKAGLSEKITCTLVRKTAVSTIHQEVPAMAANLADLMCHRTETAAKCYRLVNREKTSVEAARQLSILTGASSTEQSQKTELPSTSDCRRAVWMSEDVNSLKAIFSQELQTSDFSMPSVKMKMRKPEGQCLAHFTVRQVYDKLRSETQNSEKNGESSSQSTTVSLPEIPEAKEDEDRSSDIVPPSSNSTFYKVFTQEEITVILDCCKSIVESGPVSQDRITESLNSSVAGLHILKKFPLAQITNRLKYERRRKLMKATATATSLPAPKL